MHSANVFPFAIIAFILLRANFCTAIEEWPLDRWRSDDTDFKYLALLKCNQDGKDEHCAGSIPSPSTVLSFCPCSDTTGTKAYAGLRKVEEATETPGEGIQLRKVTKVDAHANNTNLKVYYVSENWELNENVKSIELRFKEQRRTAGTSCKVLGFGTGEARMMDQTLGGADQCGLLEAADDLFYSAIGSGEELSELDRGGPAVCSGVQWGISVAALADQPGGPTSAGATGTSSSTGTTATTPTPENPPTDRFRRGSRGVSAARFRRGSRVSGCNTYLNIIFYRDWLQPKTSSGKSIHRHSKKMCKYEVLCLLVLSIVISLLL